MKTPFDVMLDALEWTILPPPSVGRDDAVPYATHEGTLCIGGVSLKVYQLNTGMRIIDADDFKRFCGVEP